MLVGLLQAMAAGAAWAAASGGQVLRGFALGSFLLGMLLPLLASLEAGLMAMILFEPFRGLIRRAQYLIVPYSDTEPIHLLTPIAALFAFLIVLQRHKRSTFLLTPTAKLTSMLALICLVQVFNPLQGGLFVGFSGALFVLVPMVWFYFGQHSNADFFPRVMKVMVVIGIVTSSYGVYQTLAGYPAFEQYWIDNTDNYGSIAISTVTRAIATFSNSEEWGRYVQLGCIIAVGFAVARTEGRLRPVWGLCAAILAAMLVLTGQRSSIFGLFLGLTVLFIAGARTWGSTFRRVGGLAALLAVFILGSSQFAPEDDLSRTEGVNTIVSHTTKGTLNPTAEYSFGARFETWYSVITRTIPSNPLGAGLGATTLSGTRGDFAARAIDNHFFTLAISAGVPAALLLMWIFWKSFRTARRLCDQAEPNTREFAHARIALALVATLFLNNFFGTTFVIYSIAPIGWLLLGWLSARGAVEAKPVTVRKVQPRTSYGKRLAVGA